VASWARGEGRATPASTNLGIPRTYIPQGRADDLLAELGLDGPGVAASVRQLIDRTSPRTPTVSRLVELEEPATRNEATEPS
jgi:hypothetical protein